MLKALMAKFLFKNRPVASVKRMVHQNDVNGSADR